MKIHLIYTHSELRNFTYLIETDDKDAIVIDPWDAPTITKIIDAHTLTLSAIINTHEHWDHTQGNAALVEQYGCEVWAHENTKGKIPGFSLGLKGNEFISLGNETGLKVIDTPGHSAGHLCFKVIEGGRVSSVFTGDILLNAGVGRCDNGGNVDLLYDTIVREILTLNGEVSVYPGHEYLENNLRFTLSVEPTNSDAKNWLERITAEKSSNIPIVTTIADELKINTFLRVSQDSLRESLGCAARAEDVEVFRRLRLKRDQW